MHKTQAYKLSSRDAKSEDTVVRLGNVSIGGAKPVVMAGPCSVESHEQAISTANHVKSAGATIFRGGAFKPRTSPYAFQGLGVEGLEILQKIRDETGLAIISEVLDIQTFEQVEQAVDIIQIGARSMQNVSLLRRAGQSQKPVLLKRCMSATLDEFLFAAEYIMSEGNPNVILCERGIRTFSDYTRFTLDLAIVPELKRISHLPVIVDPSHATGRAELVIPMSRAAMAAGADGLLIEVHPNPSTALSDGRQSLGFDAFETLMTSLTDFVPADRPQHFVRED